MAHPVTLSKGPHTKRPAADGRLRDPGYGRAIESAATTQLAHSWECSL